MGEQNDMAAKAMKHIAEQFEKDEKLLDSQVKKAQMLQTAAPPRESWKTCWSCGKSVPLLTRDPMDGVLVCRACAAISQFADLCDDIGSVLESVSAIVAPPEFADDPEEDEDPEEGEGEETPEEQETDEANEA